MNASSLLGDALKLGKALLPLMPTGTAEIIRAGQAAVSMFKKIKADVDDVSAEFDQTTADLEAAVLAHADRTIDKLAGQATL